MPITSIERRNLANRIQKIIKQGDKLDGLASRQYLKILNGTRNRIMDSIKTAEAWDLSNLSRIKSSIDVLINRFPDELLEVTDDMQRLSWDLGKQMVDEPLEAVGMRVGLPELTETQLLALQGTTTELIAGLTSDMRSKVRVAIDQAILGEVSPFRAGQKVDSIVAGIKNRGEKIIRTEVGRAGSVATQMRMGQSREFVPKLQKQWLWSGIEKDTRPSHMAINGQVRDIDKPFDLRNDRTGEIENPMYPRDPILSAYNVVNCKCQSIPYSEDWI